MFLFLQILEHTPNSHPDRLHLEEALAKAEEICLQVFISFFLFLY